MPAYISTCPNCNSDIDIPETTGWSPVDDPEDHGDGGWSNPVICPSCHKEYMVHWIGNLPVVVSETFYRVIDMGKGKVMTERMRLMLGKTPNVDAPKGLGKRQIDRIFRKGGTFEEMQQRLSDTLLSVCAEQAGIPIDEAKEISLRRSSDPS